MDKSMKKILGIAISILLYITTTLAANVNIYGIDSEHKIDEDYIVVVKRYFNQTNKHIDGTLQSVEQFAKDLSATDDDDYVVSHKYSFGNFAALRVKLDQENIKKLSEHFDVDFVQANQKVSIYQTDDGCISQSTGNKQWGLSRLSTHSKPDYSGAKYTYLKGDGEGVEAYVVDTGVYVDHEDLKGRASSGFVSSTHSSEGMLDKNGHGTHVAGIVAGTTSGVAKNAKIISVKVLGKDGTGTTADIIEGLQWISKDFEAKKKTKGKKAKAVVNMSLGGAPGQVGAADEAAITTLITNGLTFSIAAGNDNHDSCSVSPARLASAITVGAINMSDVMPDYSNYGPCVDILAPGDAIRSAYIGSTSTYAILSGTSMAAPFVAGLVARYLSQLCEAPSPAATKAWLEDTATPDMVNIGSKASTPNKLTYMDCVAGSGTAPKSTDFVRTAFNPTEENVTFWMLIAMGVVLVVCLSGFIVSCVTLSKIKKVQRDQKNLVHPQIPRGYQAITEANRLIA